MKKHERFRPAKIKIEPTKERLTNASGLGTIIEVFDQSPLAREFQDCLPKRLSNRSLGSYRLGLLMLSSLIYGHDCLDDLEEFEDDPKLKELFRDGVCAPRTMGDFLYDFDDEEINKLKKFLVTMSRYIRKDLIAKLPVPFTPNKAIRTNQDSTSHIQHGFEIEGVELNYKGEWCLDSLDCYDEIGLCQGYELRYGNTFSSVNADKMINEVFDGFSFSEEKYYSGDSAFCNEAVMRALMSKGVKFTITAHGNMNWEQEAEKIDKWVEWEYSESDKKKFEKKKQNPPKILLGRYHYSPGFAPHLKLPVIVKKTWIEDWELGGGHWKLYAVLTDFDLFKHSYQSVIEFHNKRGNAENFIREGKHNLDLKHFPCLKLKANYAYALFAMIAHNLLRWMALLEKPEKPHFAKKLRRKFIYIPGKLVTHARQTVLRVREQAYKEVMRIREAWQPRPIAAFSTS